MAPDAGKFTESLGGVVDVLCQSLNHPHLPASLGKHRGDYRRLIRLAKRQHRCRQTGKTTFITATGSQPNRMAAALCDFPLIRQI